MKTAWRNKCQNILQEAGDVGSPLLLLNIYLSLKRSAKRMNGQILASEQRCVMHEAH
jgi:hypothetical protein